MTHQRKGETRADYLQRGKNEYRVKHPLQTIALWKKVEHMTPQERAAFLFVERGEIVHNALWIQTRDSFHASKEWRHFSQAIRAGVTVCPICKRTITIDTKSYITGNAGNICFHTHHRAGYELDKRVIEHGFLFDLQDKSKFAIICGDCHYAEHGDLIVRESKVEHVDYDGLTTRALKIKERLKTRKQTGASPC